MLRKLLFSGLIALCSIPSLAQDTVNIRTNPFMALTGRFVNIGLDVRLTEQWSLGPTVQTQTDEPLYQVGLRLNHFEQGTFQRGWQTGLELNYRLESPIDAYYENGKYCYWVEQSLDPVCDRKASSFLSLAATHGYLWRWERFNVALGLGSKLSSPTSDLGNISLNSSVHFSVGWVR